MNKIKYYRAIEKIAGIGPGLLLASGPAISFVAGTGSVHTGKKRAKKTLLALGAGGAVIGGVAGAASGAAEANMMRSAYRSFRNATTLDVPKRIRKEFPSKLVKSLNKAKAVKAPSARRIIARGVLKGTIGGAIMLGLPFIAGREITKAKRARNRK